MKNINKKIALILTLSLTVNATDYDNAEFENYVSGQGVNDVIATAQLIVCKLSKLGTKELAGDGSYKATIFADECTETGGSNDSSQGTTAPTSSQMPDQIPVHLVHKNHLIFKRNLKQYL